MKGFFFGKYDTHTPAKVHENGMCYHSKPVTGL
jgi:hypothetical protein